MLNWLGHIGNKIASFLNMKWYVLYESTYTNYNN